MLPGFRVALATVVLTISVLVFGLGAAALLRASHDQFATLPPAQAPRDAASAREQDARQVTLAMLRVEMMAEQQVASPTAPPLAIESPSAPAAVDPVVSALDPVVSKPVTVRDEAAVEPLTAAPLQEVAVSDRPREETSSPNGADAVAAPLAAVAAKIDLPVGDGADRLADTIKGPVCTPPPAAASLLQLSMLGDPARAAFSLSLLKRSGAITASLNWPPGSSSVRHRHRPLRLQALRSRRHRLALRIRTQALVPQQSVPGDPFASLGQSSQARAVR